MKTKAILKHLRFIILPVAIASLGGFIFYCLWVYQKLNLNEDIYFMIVVAGILNGLLIAVMHYIISTISRSKYLKINLN